MEMVFLVLVPGCIINSFVFFIIFRNVNNIKIQTREC